MIVGIRPEDLRSPDAGREGTEFKGDVELVEALGAELLVHFSTDAKMLQSDRLRGEEASGEDGSEVASACVARVEPGQSVRSGDRFTFIADVRRFEFFDPATEQSIWD